MPRTPGAGRHRGSLNKRTLEQAEIAERRLIEAQRTGRKLAKDELEDIAHICKSAAAYFQPTIVTEEMELAAAAAGKEPKVNKHGDWERFDHWLWRAQSAFEAYAKYQSPQLRAIALQTPVGTEVEQLGSYSARERLERKITQRIVAEEIELEATEITESPQRKNVA